MLYNTACLSAVNGQKVHKILDSFPPNSSFRLVQRSVDNYFKFPESSIQEYKLWKRYEWLAQRRLNAAGLVDDAEKYNSAAAIFIGQTVLKPYTGLGNEIKQWVPVGPEPSIAPGNSIGSTNCIAWHPTDAATFYLGTAGGGLWKTTNSGFSFDPVSAYLASTSAQGVAISPADANTLLLIGGDGNLLKKARFMKPKGAMVYKSTDGGDSWAEWSLVSDSAVATFGNKIIIHPLNADLVFAATTAGLWRSVNGGAQWTRCISGVEITDVEMKPGEPYIMYASGLSGNFFYSSDTGRTWTSRLLASGVDRMELAVTAANPNRIYALCGPAGNTGTFKGLITCNGTNPLQNTWTEVATSPNIFGRNETGQDALSQSFRNIVLYVSPTNENHITAGGSFLWRSANGGITFTRQTNQPNPEINFLEQNPLTGNLYCGTDGGLFEGGITGDNWTQVGANLQIAQVYRFGQSANSPGSLMLGGMGVSVQGKTDAGNYSALRSELDGGDAIIDYDSSSVLYAVTENGIVHKSTNSSSMAPLQSQPTQGEDYWVTNLLMHPINHRILFFGGFGGIRRSTDGGASWTSIGASGKDAMAIGVSNPDRLYAADGLVVKRTDNATASPAEILWTNITSNSTNFPSSPSIIITGMAVNPDNSQELWVTCSGYLDGQKVYRTLDSGATWTNMSAGLPNLPVHCIVYEDNNGNPGGAVYIGTDLGVFYRDNWQDGWVPFGNGLPNVPVTALNIFYGTTRYITASTYGRGLWQTATYTRCSDEIQLDGPVQGFRYFEAAKTLVSSNLTLQGGIGTDVRNKAGESITLNPGVVLSGEAGVYKAWISPCGIATVPDPSLTAFELGVDDVEEYFRQLPEEDSDVKDGTSEFNTANGISYVNFTSDGVNKTMIYMVGESGERLGYFLNSYIPLGKYRMGIPKRKKIKPVKIVIEAKDQKTIITWNN
jgi:photosystem II stability/assembly factor-like uncharacterized protein